MWNGIRAALLLALVLGMGLSSSAMASRICVATLSHCCCEDAAPESVPDCCETAPEGCCLVILSDEAAMLAPAGSCPVVFAAVIPELAGLRHCGVGVSLMSGGAVPESPPPLSARERLVRFSVQLV